MTTAEIRAFYISQIAFYKRMVEHENNDIEYLNREIKRQRAESKRLVEYVWSAGVLKKYEFETFTADYKNIDLIKAERDRAKAYRSRKRYEKYIREYENKLQKLEPKPQPTEEVETEPQTQETEAQAQQQEAETMTEPKPTRGTIASTGERCEMRANGYWTSNGKHITSYKRIDKPIEYNERGAPVIRQYSMDKNHKFYIETEDEAPDSRDSGRP